MQWHKHATPARALVRIYAQFSHIQPYPLTSVRESVLHPFLPSSPLPTPPAGFASPTLSAAHANTYAAIQARRRRLPGSTATAQFAPASAAASSHRRKSIEQRRNFRCKLRQNSACVRMECILFSCTIVLQMQEACGVNAVEVWCESVRACGVNAQV